MKNNVVETGTLKKYNECGYTELPYDICRLSSDDLEVVLKIIQFAQKTYGERFLARNPVQIQQILVQNLSFGLFCENDLVGIRLSGYPTLETLYLLDFLPVSFHESQRDARLTGLVILPPYRRQHFGSYLTEINLKYLAQQGRDRIWATVSPSNYPSLKLFLGLNFRIYHFFKTAKGYNRFLLRFETFMKPLCTTKVELVKFSDIALQSELTKCGWVGYAVTEDPLNYQVMYTREMDDNYQNN